MKKFLLFSITLLTLLIISSCGTARESLPAADKPVIYTTIYPVYDFTRKIGGEQLEVINIVPPGAQPHSFEPSSKRVAEISKALLLIYNGAGMEAYMPKLAKTLENAGVKLVDTSQGIPLLANPEIRRHDGHDEHPAEPHGEYDPHIWLSPSRAVRQSQSICQALCDADPQNRELYEANLRSLQEELQLLDREFRTTLDKCRKKELVVSHAAFQYLTDDYGLEQIPLMGTHADAEPGPATLKEAIRIVKDNNIAYIFADPFDSPKIAQTVAAETGAAILPLNSLGALTEYERQAGKDYLQVMRDNLANLKKGLEYMP